MKRMSQFAFSVLAGLIICALAVYAQETRPNVDQGHDAQTAAAASGEARDLGGARPEVYKRVGEVELKIYFFMPPGHQPTDKRPAIVFFHGGGNRPSQFAPQCKYFASRGMVAATADYWVRNVNTTHAGDSASGANGQAAVRWIRAHARELGVDPERIAAGGGSAGGYVTVATGMLKDFTGDKGASISFRPNAMVLFNTGVVLTPDKAAKRGVKAEEHSPMDNVRPGLPPTIILVGKSDEMIPFEQVEAFAKAMKAAGNRCELVGFDGQGHGFFNYGRGDNRFFRETLKQADEFLASLGYLSGPPQVERFLAR